MPLNYATTADGDTEIHLQEDGADGMYSYDQVCKAVNSGVDMIAEEFEIHGESDSNMFNLVVNAILASLQNPEVSIEMVAEEFYSEPLSEIKTWLDF